MIPLRQADPEVVVNPPALTKAATAAIEDGI